MYTAKSQDPAVESVARALDAAGVPNDRSEPVWIESEKTYMTAFYYSLSVKKGI